MGDARDCSVSRLSHDFEDFAMPILNGLSDETGSCQVAIDRSRLLQFCPEINQHKVAFADCRVITGPGFVVGIAAV